MTNIASEKFTPLVKPISIGAVKLDIPVILAPMAGVTDMPYRRMVRKFGAGLVVSEMIASQAMIRECRKTMQMIRTSGEGIADIQIAGGDPAVMAEAAKMNEDRGAQIIDMNFGCPAKKVVNGQAGSALMKDEALSARIVEAVVAAVSVPVTIKMRLGWNDENRNAPRLAKIAEECGVKMVTVHGRTRCQFYQGEADWEAIRSVKESVSVPVIANGDIRDFDTAQTALERSGADGIMVGRATYGRPWFLAQLMAFLTKGERPENPTRQVLYETLSEHFENLLTLYGVPAGLRIARKHIGWYSKALPQSAAFRSAINACDDVGQVRDLISSYFVPLLDQAA
jgi:tRNA-dihydrouridine synthase B